MIRFHTWHTIKKPIWYIPYLCQLSSAGQSTWFVISGSRVRIPKLAHRYGEIPERSKGADCKSVGSAFQGSNPCLPIFYFKINRGEWAAEVRRFSFFGCFSYMLNNWYRYIAQYTNFSKYHNIALSKIQYSSNWKLKLIDLSFRIRCWKNTREKK